jgi:hypothetical protein
VIERFNRGASSDFWRIGRLVLNDWEGLSTDELSKSAIDALIRSAHAHPWVGRLLGHAATENFAESILLPRLEQNPSEDWIRHALDLAGPRHNRRYIIPR